MFSAQWFQNLCDHNQLIRCLTPAEANHFCFSKNDKIERYPIAIHCYRMKSIQCCRFNQYKQTQEFSGALVGSHNALPEPLPDQCGGKRASSSKLKAGERLNLNLQRCFSRVAAGRYFKNFTLLRIYAQPIDRCNFVPSRFISEHFQILNAFQAQPAIRRLRYRLILHHC